MAGPIRFNNSAAVSDTTYSFPNGYAGGIDISQSADLIAANRSPDMVNMNYDAGGVPTKRYGFDAVNAIAYGTQDIRGLFEFEKSDGTLLLLMAWNGKLWSVASDGAKTDLCTGAKTSIADAQISGFVFNDKFYFLTGTEYCYYDGTNPVAAVTGYIPTVYVGRAPTGGGTINESFNLLSDSWKESFSATAGATVFHLSEVDIDSVDSIYVSGSLVDPANYTFDLAAGTAIFYSGVAAGTDNVLIQATKTGLTNETIITRCQFHCFYGGQNDTRVFFSGNPAYKNYRFMSGLMDVTYWPDDGDQAMPGSDADAVMGMGKMGNYLITLTEERRYWTDVSVSDTSLIFALYPLNDQYGCTSWRTAALAQDGLLCLSRDGVTWTSTTAVRSQLGTRVISESINRSAAGMIPGLLSATKAEMEAAYAYLYRNKYYLHVGAKCWVLDLDYSVLSSGIYCWYPYTGLYSTLTQLLERQDGLLWAGDDGGKVYKSNQLYSDAGVAIDAWWTSPILFGDRSWIKKFDRLNLTFGGQAKADHVLTVITDEGAEDTYLMTQDTRSLDYGAIDYGNWTYGCVFYPSTQSEKVGYKGEYVQWRIRNNTLGEKLVILAQTLIYHATKRVK